MHLKTSSAEWQPLGLHRMIYDVGRGSLWQLFYRLLHILITSNVSVNDIRYSRYKSILNTFAEIVLGEIEIIRQTRVVYQEID